MKRMLTLVLLLMSLSPAAWAQPEGGAVGGSEPPAAAPDTPPPAEQAPPAPSATPAPRARAESDGTTGRHGVLLPAGLRLNGFFDGAYERRGYSGDLGDGHDELRNYHHFVFLTRQSASDPFGINVELVDLTFYEITYRLHEIDKPWRVLARAGKIVVPFGVSEPLFHNAYGGRAGFDQELLPLVWSQLGLAVQGQLRLGDFAVRDDLYIIQGYKLSAPDAVINLQSDFSSTDDVRFGFGDRLGISYGPLTAMYSIYLNRVGFRRLLVMQALDLGLARVPGVPVLDRLEVAVGAVRADVSGGFTGVGGAGKDYYHFGDYLTVRFWPTDWLWLQARGGFKTVDNRRGLYYDSTRKSQDDRSSYNVALGVVSGGLGVSLWHFWNLEKVNEKKDDFLRLWVTYAF